MKRLVSILSGVIMLLALLPGSTAKGQDSVFLPAIFRHISERAALVALYESTDGDDWTTNYNWLSDSVHHCEWYGITCTSEEGVVRQIELSLNNLQGAIPREIGNLANLQGLWLGGNNLTSLPAEIGYLTKLRVLQLDGNSLSSLPPTIGNLTNMGRLRLESNDLTSLPLEIGNLANLQELRLDENPVPCLPGTLFTWYESIPERSPASFGECP